MSRRRAISRPFRNSRPTSGAVGVSAGRVRAGRPSAISVSRTGLVDGSEALAAQDGPVGEYVQALAARASTRQAHLGRDVADRAPGWAVEALGAVPDPEAVERAGWERRAGIAAAYRELRGIDDDQASLGAAPSREQELPRALWAHAVEALGRPADVTDHRALSDAALYQQVERWERELVTAPGWVAEQLGAAYEAAHEERVAHQLAGAELAALPPGEDRRREQLVADRDRAGVWAGWHAERAAAYEAAHQARQVWAQTTREQEQQARLAAEELDRRGLRAHRDLTPTTPEPAQEREQARAEQDVAQQDVAQTGMEQHIEHKDVAPAGVEQAVEQVATREERAAAWRTRPDRLLGEPALTEALSGAERARDTALAQAERLRAQIPGLAEQVTAGRGEQVAALVDAVDTVEALDRHLLDRHQLTRDGHVERNGSQPTELVYRCLCVRLDLIRVRGVGDPRHDSVFTVELLEAGFAQIDSEDTSSFLDEATDGGRPDPARGTGDNGDLACHSTHMQLLGRSLHFLHGCCFEIRRARAVE